MISEEMLKKAAAEADQAIRDSLPAPEGCKHEFSPLFQRKMRHAFCKAKHPVIYKLPKYAACFVLAVVLTSGTWLTVDAEARAAFFAWMREQYAAFVEYRFIGQPPQESESIDYKLTWLPEGYSEIESYILAGSSIAVYRNETGQIIQFSYSRGGDATSLFVKSDYSKIIPTELGNVLAEYYEAKNHSDANALVWISEDGEIMFCITAFEHKEVLVKMAENVTKNNLKKSIT